MIEYKRYAEKRGRVNLGKADSYVSPFRVIISYIIIYANGREYVNLVKYVVDAPDVENR